MHYSIKDIRSAAADSSTKNGNFRLNWRDFRYYPKYGICLAPCIFIFTLPNIIKEIHIGVLEKYAAAESCYKPCTPVPIKLLHIFLF